MPLISSIHLFDLDEIYFAEVTREMLNTGNYGQLQMGFTPFYEKPPLFFWLQALSMQFWGINELGARFPNAIVGVFTLLTLYCIGKKYKDRIWGLLWALMYLSAFLPHFYFKSGIIDPVFNYFIFLGIVCITLMVDNQYGLKQLPLAAFGGFWVGLAILTKGPVGLLIPLLTFLVYWVGWQRNYPIPWLSCALFLAVSLFVPFCWCGSELYQHGHLFFKEFCNYQISLFSAAVPEHAQPFYYHFWVLLIGCFPVSILAIARGRQQQLENIPLSKMMLSLLGVVVVLFTMVETKIVHYTSIAYFPITFLAADCLYKLLFRLVPLRKWLCISWLFMGIFIAFFLVVLPLSFLYKDILNLFISDDLVRAALTLPVNWSWNHCCLGGGYSFALVLAYFLLKRRKIIGFALCCSISTTLCLSSFIILIAPKIERYSQGPLITFCKELRGKSVYLTTIGFKSCAPLFYAVQSSDSGVFFSNPEWLLVGKIDRPAFFILKTTDMAIIEGYGDIELIKEEGCFAFYKRDPALAKE